MLSKVERKTEPREKTEFEECVLCHESTAVHKDTLIERREHYIYGVGQLCLKCFYKTYCKSND